MIMASSALECDVCSNKFGEDHCPRILPCSHTFCANCIDGIITTQRRLCPLCRRMFFARTPEEVMINRGLLEVAKQLSSSSLDAKNSSKEPRKSFLDFSKDFREKFTKKGLADCEQTEALVMGAVKTYDKIKDVVLRANTDIEELTEILQEKKVANADIIRDIEESVKPLRKNLAFLLDDKKSIEECDAALEAATNFTSVIDEAERAFDDAQEKIKDMMDCLHKNEKKANDIKKGVLEANIMLGSILQGLKGTREEDSPVPVTVNDLRSLCNPLKEVVQREIVAVAMFEGKRRLARIKIESESHVSMSHLIEGDVPPKCFYIEAKSLINLSSRRVFLDLEVCGRSLGRITMTVKDEGNKSLNFLHMCAGDLGPSYANSQLLDVDGKGKDGESIGIGEYLVEGGTSRESVLPDVEWDREQEKDIYEETPHKAGQVRGIFSKDAASEFYIVTRDDPSWVDRCCFGMVEDGIDILKDAILQHPDISCVKIANCGLLISL